MQKVPRQIPDPEPWTNAPSRQHSQQPLSIPWAPRPDSRNTPPPKPKKESPFTIEQLQQKRSQWQDQRQLAESRMLQRGRQLLNRVQERSYGGAIGLHKPLTASACVTTRSMMRSCPGAVSLNERQLIDQMFEKAQNSVKLSKRQQRMDAEQRPPPRQQQVCGYVYDIFVEIFLVYSGHRCMRQPAKAMWQWSKFCSKPKLMLSVPIG